MSDEPEIDESKFPYGYVPPHLEEARKELAKSDPWRAARTFLCAEPGCLGEDRCCLQSGQPDEQIDSADHSPEVSFPRSHKATDDS